MPTLSGLTSDRRPITVKYGDHKISVVYKPSAYNGDWAKKLAANAKDEDTSSFEALAESLAAAIVEWDITEDDGTKVQPTPEVLSALGLGVMNAIETAINADLLPNRKPGRS